MLPMTALLPSTASLSFTEDPLIIEAFTHGDCWRLALALHERLGLPVALLGFASSPEDTWLHAGNLLPSGAFVDITGVHPVEEVLDAWEYMLRQEEAEEGEEGGVFEVPPEAFPRAFVEQEPQYAAVAHPAEWALVVEAGLRSAALL